MAESTTDALNVVADTSMLNAPPTILDPDAALIALVKRGDEGAILRLYDAHSRMVYSVALRVLRDPDAAEDVLQDVFLHLWRTPATFVAGRGSLGAWLAVIARNRAIDVLRKRRLTDSVDDLPLKAPGDLCHEVERSLLVARIKALIGRLPLVQQEVLELAYFRGWTHAEIAESTSIPLGTIKTRIRSALRALEQAVRKPASPLLSS